MNIIAINLIKLKYQILAHSIFFEGIIAFYTTWFINDEELDLKSDKQNQR